MTITTAAVAVLPLSTVGNTIVEACTVHREGRADGAAEEKRQVIDESQKAAGPSEGRHPSG